MDYKLSKEQSTINIIVTATKEEWEAEMQSAYERTKGKYEVQGFRKGKAPRKQIELAYGSNIFFEEALENFCAESYSEVLKKETDIKPVAYPRMSLQKSDENGIEVLFSVDVMPEIELGAYTGLEIEKVGISMSDEEIEHQVEHQLEHQLEHSARMQDIEGRSVQNGDIANINFVGKVDGVAFDGGTGEDYDLAIGSHTFIEGFEEQIIGMNIGDERDINVTFPTEYHSEELAGKPSVFTVKLNAIKEKILPEMNDEWASDVSEFETLAEYKEDIKKGIVEKLTSEAEVETEGALIRKIVEASKMDIPHSMIDTEIDYMMNTYSQRLSYQGLTLEDYIKFTGTTMEQFRENCHHSAHENVEARLVLQAIIEKEKIEATEADIDAKIEEIASQYGQSAEEMKKQMDSHYMSHLHNEVVTDKVFAFLKENNKFVDKKSK